MPNARKRGVTLLEVIVVITILAMLLGISVAFMRGANRDLGVSAAGNYVVGLLHGAHQQARSNSAPAMVVLNVKNNTVHLLSQEPVGEWHFEDATTTGAFGRNGRVHGARLVTGRVGMGMQFGGSAHVDCGEVPIYSSKQGLAVSFWVNRKPSRGTQVLCTIGKEMEIAVEGDGELKARFGSLNAATGSVKLPFDAWCHIRMVCAAQQMRLYVNDVPLVVRTGTPEWTKSSPFIVGGARAGFAGVIDEVKLSLIIPREEYLLPHEARFELPAAVKPSSEGDFIIHFDEEGRLDRLRHSEPARFKIKSPVHELSIGVGMGGNVLR
jgi:prepilin-type N-terminal cleavage/methylation domain-containing protein